MSGAVDPIKGELIVWAADRTDNFGNGPEFQNTQTAVYFPNNGEVKLFPVDYIGHDMFCPGISFDFNGNLLVTGGSSSEAASLFNSQDQVWSKQTPMKLGRGYQSSTTISDGRIFTIGGSWSGNLETAKNGEIWDGNNNAWTLLPECQVEPMRTADSRGIYRQDNHAWLFAWKNESVFQAGPSTAMNWYTTEGEGSVSPAGRRGPDAMCGPAVMFDAVAGSILAVGGAPEYEKTDATAEAYVVKIKDVGGEAEVERVADMQVKRIFANSIVLPDGTVFVVGGQAYGKPFSDETAAMAPELWDPSTKEFSLLAEGPTPRTYHSIALLMPDATVFSGGGGLCGDCNGNPAANHFDGEMYSPPYLFQDNGETLAARPRIAMVNPEAAQVGSDITVTIEAEVAEAQFSLVRMGSSTHTINTDQRRVPLEASFLETMTETGRTTTSYSITLPGDPGILLPGYWYLFAMVNGVPSVAAIIKVTL